MLLHWSSIARTINKGGLEKRRYFDSFLYYRKYERGHSKNKFLICKAVLFNTNHSNADVPFIIQG